MLKTTNSIKEKIIFDEPMKKHTSFKIGGTADQFIKVANETELKEAIKLLGTTNVSIRLYEGVVGTVKVDVIGE